MVATESSYKEPRVTDPVISSAICGWTLGGLATYTGRQWHAPICQARTTSCIEGPTEVAGTVRDMGSCLSAFVLVRHDPRRLLQMMATSDADVWRNSDSYN